MSSRHASHMLTNSLKTRYSAPDQLLCHMLLRRLLQVFEPRTHKLPKRLRKVTLSYVLSPGLDAPVRKP